MLSPSGSTPLMLAINPPYKFSDTLKLSILIAVGELLSGSVLSLKRTFPLFKSWYQTAIISVPKIISALFNENPAVAASNDW